MKDKTIYILCVISIILDISPLFVLYSLQIINNYDIGIYLGLISPILLPGLGLIISIFTNIKARKEKKIKPLRIAALVLSIISVFVCYFLEGSFLLIVHAISSYNMSIGGGTV